MQSQWHLLVGNKIKRIQIRDSIYILEPVLLPDHNDYVVLALRIIKEMFAIPTKDCYFDGCTNKPANVYAIRHNFGQNICLCRECEKRIFNYQIRIDDNKHKYIEHDNYITYERKSWYARCERMEYKWPECKDEDTLRVYVDWNYKWYWLIELVTSNLPRELFVCIISLYIQN